MITRDEWLAALQEASTHEHENDPSVLTMNELAALLGVHPRTAREQAAKLIEAGRVERATKFIRNTAGNYVKVPGYRFRT